MEYIGEHPIGMCFHNHSKNHAYYNIPKNASMTLRGLFLHNNYSKSNISNLQPTTKLTVVLRDPYKRFKSAVNMYLGKRDYNYRLNGKLLTRNVDVSQDSLLTNDEHFLKQTFFTDLIRGFKNIDYFFCNKNLATDISSYYNLTLNKNLNENQSLNIVTEINKKTVENIYRDDYTLIKNLHFINNA